MIRLLFVLLLVLSLTCACAVARVVHHPKPDVAANHDHAILMNIHGLLTQMEGGVRNGIPQEKGDPKKYPSSTVQVFDQTAYSFNAASAAWDDYQFVLRTHGDKGYALQRFRDLLSIAVDNGAELERLRLKP